MDKKRKNRIAASLVCLTTILWLSSCGKGHTAYPFTQNTGHDAPVSIESDTIMEFYASFQLNNRWTATDCHTFEFCIKPNEDGILTAYENYADISCPAGEKLTDELQNIISRYGLEKLNGMYKTAAGLAPGYQKCTLSVSYTSGERLEFTCPNDPHAQWAEEIYTAFAEWFAENGNTALYPVQEKSSVESFSIRYKNNGENCRYRTVKYTDAEADTVFIEKTVSDISGEKTVAKVSVPEDCLKTVADIAGCHNLVLNYDFSRYDHCAKDYGNHDRGYYGMGVRKTEQEADSDTIDLSIYIKYESGRIININTRKVSEINGMEPMLTELLEYLNLIF